MAQRHYEPATVFNARIADMRHLWIPSDTFKGQKTQKPNYFAMFLVKKTQPTWHSEPALDGAVQACGRIFEKDPHIVTWPIIDGDVPSPEGKSSEFAKGHWLFSASSGNPPVVELAQTNGQLMKLPEKKGVKSGDHVIVAVTAAVKQTARDVPRGVKFYLNAVVFSSPGEEIVFANSVSTAELMQQAQRQGLQVAGFAGSPGFGGFTNGPLAAQNVLPPFGGFTPSSTVAPTSFQGATTPVNTGQFQPPAWPPR